MDDNLEHSRRRQLRHLARAQRHAERDEAKRVHERLKAQKKLDKHSAITNEKKPKKKKKKLFGKHGKAKSNSLRPAVEDGRRSTFDEERLLLALMTNNSSLANSGDSQQDSSEKNSEDFDGRSSDLVDSNDGSLDSEDNEHRHKRSKKKKKKGLQYSASHARDADALAQSVVESEQLEPALKAVFDANAEYAVLQRLDVLIQEKEAEIEDSCSWNHTEFVRAIEGLLSVRNEADSLREGISSINDEVQEAGLMLLASLRDVQRYEDIAQNIDIASTAIRECMAIAGPVEEAQEHLRAGRRYAAYRCVQSIEGDLLPAFKQRSSIAGDLSTPGDGRTVSESLFLEHMSQVVSDMRGQIEQAVTREFNQWLFRLREAAPSIGVVAMRQQRFQMKTEQEVSRGFGSSADLLTDVFENEQHCVHFTSLYECLHVYAAIGGERLEAFRNAYLDSRRAQLGLILHPSVSSTKAVEITEQWESESESDAESDTDERNVFGDDDSPEIPQATQRLLVTLVGFFVAEHRIARTGRISTVTQQTVRSWDGIEEDWLLALPSAVDAMWQGAIRVVRTSILDCVAQVQTSRALGRLKSFWSIFVATMQRYNYDTRPILDILPRLSSGFGELVVARAVISISDWLEKSVKETRTGGPSDLWSPLLVKSAAEYEDLIVACGLAERALTSAAEAATSPRNSRNRTESGDDDEAISAPGESVAKSLVLPQLPLVCDFSILVPRYSQLLQEIVDDYFDFTDGLSAQAYTQPRHEVVREAAEKAILSLNTTYSGWLQSLSVTVGPQATSTSILAIIARSWVNFGALAAARKQWQLLLASRASAIGQMSAPESLGRIVLPRAAADFSAQQGQVEVIMTTAVRRFVAHTLQETVPSRRWGAAGKAKGQHDADVASAASQLDSVQTVGSGDLSDVASFVRASSVAQPFASVLEEYLRTEFFSALRLLPMSTARVIQQRSLSSLADAVLDELYACPLITELGLAQLSCDIAVLELAVRQHALSSDGQASSPASSPILILAELREVVRVLRSCIAANALIVEFENDQRRAREFPSLHAHRQRWPRLADLAVACRAGIEGTRGTSGAKKMFATMRGKVGRTPNSGLAALAAFLTENS